MEEITVFGKKYEISKQAKVTLYAYVTSLVTFTLTAFMTDVSTSVKMVMFITLSILTVLATYVVNCIVVGKCHLYAWIVAVLAILSAAGYVATFLITVYSKISKGKMKKSSRK